jgi:hypothetical protein
MPDQKAETCARIFASQRITRHGTGSQLITEQGAPFMAFSSKKHAKYLESAGPEPRVNTRPRTAWREVWIEPYTQESPIT